ncbi:MAG: YihA family ribosome biogenesis GTP-binding protein [Rhodospirillales bacterium]|jgi:GTP-binding protein|nr:YihA family ribosome biogenesis GTP-binding protein [Rhodospirillales bacterium]
MFPSDENEISEENESTEAAEAAPAFDEDGVSPEQLEVGRLLFAKECTFVLGAVKLDQIPTTSLPEIAFAGRSNVGKSSLINTLTRRKYLARTSNTPGRTQEINFFNLDEKLMIADLPGFGYAKVSRSRVEEWTKLVNSYLKGRAQLRRVLLLVDSRHGLKSSDLEVMKMLDVAAVSYQIVLTKSDKIGKVDCARLIKKINEKAKHHTALHPEVIATSSRKGIGIDILRARLAALCED